MRMHVAMGMVAMVLALPVAASGINSLNGAMPNRISMNVTVPKQTQGATFGEKVSSGLQSGASALAQGAAMQIDIGCDAQACLIGFPDGDGYRADLARLQLAPLDAAGRSRLQHWGDPHVDRKGPQIAQGAALVGGALPGGSILSAAVSAVGGMHAGSGAAAASYAATGRAAALPSDSSKPGSIDVTQPLADGEYQLTVVVEKATSGLKDTLKTQVRAAAPAPARVQVVVGFSVQDGALKTKHDTAKNSISNIR